MTGRGGERDAASLQSGKPLTLTVRFQQHIETSDWDEWILRGEPLFNRICLVTIILSGMALLPVMISLFMK